MRARDEHPALQRGDRLVVVRRPQRSASRRACRCAARAWTAAGRARARACAPRRRWRPAPPAARCRRWCAAARRASTASPGRRWRAKARSSRSGPAAARRRGTRRPARSTPRTPATGVKCSKYAFAPSWSMWSRRWRAWAFRRALRGRLVLGLHRLEVTAERDLRVDDHVLAADEAHDEVGPQPAVRAGDRRLRDVVDVLGHAGGLDGALELHLAPPAADLRRAQRGDQLGGLLLQLLGGRAHRAHLLQQRGVGAGAVLLDRRQLVLDTVEASRSGRHDCLDGLLALGEVAVGRGLGRGQLRLGQLDERLVVALQRLPARDSNASRSRASDCASSCSRSTADAAAAVRSASSCACTRAACSRAAPAAASASRTAVRPRASARATASRPAASVAATASRAAASLAATASRRARSAAAPAARAAADADVRPMNRPPASPRASARRARRRAVTSMTRCSHRGPTIPGSTRGGAGRVSVDWPR